MQRSLFALLCAALLLNAADVTEITTNDRDPVYQLEIGKYPKFSAELTLKNGSNIRFVSVKAMMNFYFHPEKYPEYAVTDRREISHMTVKDYLDGTPVDARKAWYVFGSRVVGPHGDDLIPFKSRASAELFVKKFGGTRIMDADKITFGLIHYLDM